MEWKWFRFFPVSSAFLITQGHYSGGFFFTPKSGNSRNVRFVKHLGTRCTKVLGEICPDDLCGSAYELYRNRLWQCLS